MKNFREKVVLYGVLILLLLMPLVVSSGLVFGYATTKIFFVYAAVQILGALWIYSVLVDKSYRLSRSEWIWLVPVLLYVGWMTIAGITAINSHLSFWSSLGRGTGLLTLYHGFMLILVVLSLSHKYGAKEYMLKIAKAMMFGGGLLGLSIWLGDEGLRLPAVILQKAGGGGFTGNSSLAGGYLIIALAMGIVLLSSKEVSRKVKNRTIIGICIIAVSPIFINLLGVIRGGGIVGSARGALIGSIAMIGVYVLMRGVYSSRRWIQYCALSLLGLGVILFGLGWRSLMTPGTALYQKFAAVASETRFAFWQIAQQAMDERPLVGYGPDNFPSAVSTYFMPRMLDKSLAFEAWTDRAHNVYYDTGVAGGYPAILLYACFFGSIVVAAYRSYKKGTIEPGQSAAIIGMVVGYVFQDLFYFDSTIAIVGIFVVAASVYATTMQPNVTSKNIKIIATEGSKGLLLISLICATSCSLYFFVLQPMSKAASFAHTITAPVDKRADMYSQLLTGSSVGNDWDVSGFAHDLYRLYAQNPVEVKSNQRLLPYAQKDVLAFAQYLEQIALTNKTDYRLYISIVHLYSTYIYLTDMPYNSDLAHTLIGYLAHAQQLSPRDPQVYWGLAQIAAWQNDMVGVISNYQKAVDLDPALPASQRLLLQFLEKMGNQKLYKAALLNAQKNIPGFAMQ